MYQKMKGTYDITTEIQYFHAVEKAIQSVSRLFNYQEIRTPHFEASELFHRGVGEDTDIVGKETYDFKDRGGRSLTLRPEGTAGVVRAYIENKLYAEKRVPQKYYYYGSSFRYERPQKGRFREFRQFGVEAFGAKSGELDAEVIAYAVTLFRALKLKNFIVHLNSLGGKDSMSRYRKALKEHFKPHLDKLCEDCNRRYETNPLRILDCKIDADTKPFKKAPKSIDHLTDEDRKHFDTVKAALTAMGIDYKIDHSLVRGLDYYTDTVFEIKDTSAALGAQDVLCGGGRYDHLVESLGGPSTPAVGFGIGIERLIIALQAGDFPVPEPSVHVYLLTLGEEARIEALKIANMLRLGGISCETDFLNRSMKAQFKQSTHHNARFVAIIGEEEVQNQTVNLKDQKERSEETLAVQDLYNAIYEKLTGKQDDCNDCEHKKGE